MNRPLISKGATFNQTCQDVVLRIQSIRKKNDQYQRLSGQQIDHEMANQILQEKGILDQQVDQTKSIIDEMEKLFKQLPQKNKLKQIRKQYEKQLSRYKQISESLMEKSVIKSAVRNSSRKSLPKKYVPPAASQGTRQVQPYDKRESSMQIAQQKQIDVDYTIERDVIIQRKQELGKVQQQMQRVYQIHQDQANMVSEQGQMIDVIGEQMLKAQHNVETSNQQLTQAAIQQKKSRKKCCLLLSLILVVIGLLIGAYFFLQ